MPHRNSAIVIFFALVCCLSGCAATPSAPAPVFESDIERKIDEFVIAYMAEHHIPGLSLAVVKAGKVAYARGYGFANLEDNLPAEPQTVYALGSVSKQFTAAAILLLVEDGKLRLEDCITSCLEGLPVEWSGVTIRHLLTHTSGIKEETWSGGRVAFSRREWRQEEVIETAFGPLLSNPGEKWNYNNAGYRLLGMVIEKISGQSYWDFLNARIFLPLTMTATRSSDPHAAIPNRAQGYAFVRSTHRRRAPVTPSAAFAAGALVSSVLDLAKWDAALYTEKLLTKSSLEAMWTRAAQIPGYPVYYGLGWFLNDVHGQKAQDHSGQILGFGAQIIRYPENELTIIVLANLEDFDCRPIVNEITGLYVPALKRRK